MIAKKNKDIATKERLSNQLIKFLKTDKGSSMVRMIGYMSIPELIRRYEAPNIARVGTSDKQMNILLYAVEKAGKSNLLRFNKVIDYTGLANKENAYDATRKRFVENYQKNKTPIRLLPYEQKLLNMRDQWRVKKDNTGKPIVRTEDDKVLYDKLSGLPIYKFTPKPNPMGLAWKMHAYEEHKMAKYDKRVEIEKAARKKSDLFPDTWDYAYKQMREAYLEQLRQDLSNLYNPAKITVVVQNKDTETVKKVPIDTQMRLGIIRKRKLQRGRTCEQFMSISHSILKDNPGSRVTCIHVDFNKHRGRVILPELFGLAA